MKALPLLSIFTIVLVAGCAASGPVSTSVEHKGSITLVHHRQKIGNNAIDHLEAINAKGVVSQAVVEVYDIGRLPDGHGNMSEASRYYHVAQSPTFDLRLPVRNGTTSSGPKTVYTPPNYVPPAKDQRINDAVAEAQAAKQRLDDASKRLNDRLAEDNTLAEQLQEARNQNQALQDKLNAAMATPQHTPNQTKTDAEKAAEGDASALQIWGQQVSNNQQ